MDGNLHTLLTECGLGSYSQGLVDFGLTSIGALSVTPDDLLASSLGFKMMHLLKLRRALQRHTEEAPSPLEAVESVQSPQLSPLTTETTVTIAESDEPKEPIIGPKSNIRPASDTPQNHVASPDTLSAMAPETLGTTPAPQTKASQPSESNSAPPKDWLRVQNVLTDAGLSHFATAIASLGVSSCAQLLCEVNIKAGSFV